MIVSTVEQNAQITKSETEAVEPEPPDGANSRSVRVGVRDARQRRGIAVLMRYRAAASGTGTAWGWAA